MNLPTSAFHSLPRVDCIGRESAVGKSLWPFWEMKGKCKIAYEIIMVKKSENSDNPHLNALVLAMAAVIPVRHFKGGQRR